MGWNKEGFRGTVKSLNIHHLRQPKMGLVWQVSRIENTG